MKSLLFVILIIMLIIIPVSADNITVVTPYATETSIIAPTETTTVAPIETGYIPTPTPISTPTPTPTPAPHPYISQGDKVYINDTIDISGVVPPYPKLAYWNGYDSYDSNASYIIDLPQYRSGYYNFYIDPTIFETRTGKWYKYNDKFEWHANTLAFVVYPKTYKNSTMRYQNGTLVNISETISNDYNEIEIPIQPPVEIKHVSDYLLARGDPLTIETNETTNIWLFGRINKLLDFKSTNATHVDLSNDVLSGFEPGLYTVKMQTLGNTSNSFTVKYDVESDKIKWFDSNSFSIKEINAFGLSPRVLEEKFNNILPSTLDIFKTYSMELQEPSIEISSINEINTINYTINYAGVTEYNTNISYIQVKGYTNVAIGSILKFVVDEKQQTPRTLKSHTTTAVAGGTNNPGDMRWFDVVIPIAKYNLALGSHTVSAYTNYSTSGSTYTFIIYDSPPNSYVPPKTIRYISGRYGAEEFVPTPTPVIQNVTQIVTIPVEITIPVTPSNEQVKAQQKIVADENLNKLEKQIIVVITIIGIAWYLISLYLRRKELE